MSHRVSIAGVGMLPFGKTGGSDACETIGAEAVRMALADAGLDFADLRLAFAGYVDADSTCGQRALHRAGKTGFPIINVNNHCSTGSTALFLARRQIESGATDCVLALRFEQMHLGALRSHWTDRSSGFEAFEALRLEINSDPEVPLALRFFGVAGQESMDWHGTGTEGFPQGRAKPARSAKKNAFALLRKVRSAEEVLAAQVPFMQKVLKRQMACPPTCGAAAAVRVSESLAQHRSWDRCVEFVAQATTTDRPHGFEARGAMKPVGADMARDAADPICQCAGIGLQDVDLVEQFDCSGVDWREPVSLKARASHHSTTRGWAGHVS